jgi:hypothetical protein
VLVGEEGRGLPPFRHQDRTGHDEAVLEGGRPDRALARMEAVQDRAELREPYLDGPGPRKEAT